MKKKTQKWLSFLLALSFIFALVPGVVQAEGDQGPETLTVLHTNDVHGYGVGDSAVDKEGKLVKEGAIGYARYKTIIDAYKKAGDVLVIDAGDATHGQNFVTLSKGVNAVKLMEAAGVDAFAPGNHDFNYGANQLKKLADDADFDILAANVFVGKDSSGSLLYKDHVIKSFDGYKVGIFGMATPETLVKSNPKNTEGLYMPTGLEENVKIAQAQVQALKDNGADVIIMISHLGLDEESLVKSSDIAKAVSGIDLIVDGHSHTTLEAGKKEGDALIVQAGAHFKNIGKAVLTIEDGKVKTKTASLISFLQAAESKEDESILKMLKGMLDENAVIESQVVGFTTEELDGVRENVRTKQTNLGTLLTDAMRKASGADVAITNGGGIRASIPAGKITVGQIMTVLPFGNQMTVIKVTGKDLVDALTFGVSEYPKTAGKFPHVSGISFELVEGKDGVANAVKNVKVAGKDIDLEKVYTLATNDFMAVGGDGYEMFKGKEQVALYESLADILKNHIAEILPLPAADRVERLSGDNRIETAVAVAKKNFKEADTVVLANGYSEVDALTVAPYAELLDAPVLLTDGKTVAPSVDKLIKDLGVKNVIIVGGTKSITEDVVKALTGLKVSRIAGNNRYETAEDIAKAIYAETDDKDDAFVVSGENMADALTVATYATREEAPILLATKDTVPQATKNALKDIEKITLIGGERSLSAKVYGEVGAKERIFGADRYETAVKIAEKAADDDDKNVVVAQGHVAADALTVGPVLDDNDQVLLLVAQDKVPASVEAYLTVLKPKSIQVVGGTKTISEAVQTALAAYIEK